MPYCLLAPPLRCHCFDREATMFATYVMCSVAYYLAPIPLSVLLNKLPMRGRRSPSAKVISSRWPASVLLKYCASASLLPYIWQAQLRTPVNLHKLELKITLQPLFSVDMVRHHLQRYLPQQAWNELQKGILCLKFMFNISSSMPPEDISFLLSNLIEKQCI